MSTVFDDVKKQADSLTDKLFDLDNHLKLQQDAKGRKILVQVSTRLIRLLNKLDDMEIE